MQTVLSGGANSQAGRGGPGIPQLGRRRRNRPTPGNAIDQARIEDDIVRIASEIGGVKKIAVDRWGAIPFMNRLSDRGLPVVQFGQGYQSMTGPYQKNRAGNSSRQFHHGGNAILRWNFSNVRPETDAAGNIKFSKDKAVEKIDGAVAAAMAIGAALANDGADGESIYNERAKAGDGPVILFV